MRRRLLGHYQCHAEQLESRLLLHGDAVENAMSPDLDVSAMETRSMRVGDELVFDLYVAGATVTDLDDDGHETEDTIRLQLDPDDGPANASLTPDGVFNWVPTESQIGVFEFVVIAVDEGEPPLADAEVFTIEVVPNHAPDLAPISDATIAVNESFFVNLSATDPENDQLTFLLDPDLTPTGAVVEPTDDGAILRWTPTANFAGRTVQLSALVVDDGLPPMGDTEFFEVTVMSVGASDDVYELTPASVLNVDAPSGVLANDIDSDGDVLTATVTQEPSNGTFSFAEDGAFTYTPDVGFQGRDSFTYQARDASGDFSSATVDINVNSDPIAGADTYTTDEDVALVVGANEGILANDTDDDSNALTASVVHHPENGILTLSDNGSFSYDPEANFNGVVTFTYIANDGIATSDETVVTITVASRNDAPIATADDYNANEDEQLVVEIDSGILTNDSDADGDPLTAAVVANPSHGSVFLNNDGTFTYTPDSDFAGTDEFTYVASDGSLQSDPTSVTIDVAGFDDPPVAAMDTYNATEGLELSIIASIGVLANDTDLDGDDLVAKLISDTTNGTLLLNSDGSFRYTAHVGFSGTDSFTYSASDGITDSQPVTTEIFVDDVNQAPIATADSYNVTEDVTFVADEQFGVLENDFDADDDTLTAVLVSGPSHGQLSLNADGSFEYVASQDSPGQLGFSYRVSDGTLSSDVISVTLSVTTINDAPVASPDTYGVTGSDPLIVSSGSGVLANDTDVDSANLVALLVGNAGNGSVTLQSDGSFTYTADAGFSGTDRFRYRASDGAVNSAAVEVEINVAPGEFGSVTVGSWRAPNLLGVRTDLQPGALPMSANHVSGVVDYSGYSNPPTYGPHHGFLLDSQRNSITPRPTGVYESEQPDEDLIHNLEHGHVWISYNPALISSGDLAALRQLVANGGTDNGVIMTPRSANTAPIALASWAHLLTLQSFDANQIRNFIETNRGKSDEGFIPSGQKPANGGESLSDGLAHG